MTQFKYFIIPLVIQRATLVVNFNHGSLVRFATGRCSTRSFHTYGFFNTWPTLTFLQQQCCILLLKCLTAQAKVEGGEGRVEWFEYQKFSDPPLKIIATWNSISFLLVEGNDEDRDYRDFYEYDDDDNGIKKAEKCPDINLPRGLGGPCKVSDFCSNITCEVKVGEKSATLIFKINQCDDPITATVTVKIQGYAVDWSHTFKDGEKIKLPLGKESGVMAQGSVSLLVVLKREGKKLHFKVTCLLYITLLHCKGGGK